MGRRRRLRQRAHAGAVADGSDEGGSSPRVWRRVGGTLLSRLLRVSLLIVRVGSTIPSLTEADFAETLRGTTSALVAFVAPWCLASRSLLTELVRVRSMLAQRSKELLVAQCDVSREVRLASKYRAWRTPVVLLFPGTRILAPGLQVNFDGQLLHGNLVAFVNGARGPPSTHVHSPEDLLEAVERRGGLGTFVGFFRSSHEDSLVQGVWTMSCVRRHHRAFALAHGPVDEIGERLWRWAGLRWDPEGARSEEAVIFVPVRNPDCEAVPSARFTLPESVGARISWPGEVERFCAWCERQVLAPVAVFDAARAAALDGTYDWLLLLFATRGSTLDEEQQELSSLFPLERRRLERFVTAACAHDKRYREVLPVLVPWGEDDIPAFRGHFGVDPADPTVPLERRNLDGTVSSTAACDQLHSATPEEDVDGAGPSRRRRVALWAAALFNTRTRLKYPMPRGMGWCPGDELGLCHFTDAALDGRVPPYSRSLERPPARAHGGGPPPGVTELIGSTFAHQAIEPVAAGLAEVLLLVYAPWCSHSLNFLPLWKSFAASVAVAAAEEGAGGCAAAEERGGVNGDAPSPAPLLLPDSDQSEKKPPGQAGRLLLAQMDGTQNEHPDLPHVGRFPTILLGVQAPARPADNATRAPSGKHLPEGGVGQPLRGAPGQGPSVRFLVYGGDASLAGLRAWVARHSVLRASLGPTALR